MTLVCVEWCLVADVTSDTSGTEEAAIKAWGISSIDYGCTRADTVARIRAFIHGIRAIDPTAFRARLRDIPDPNFVGEPRPNLDHPGPHRHDHLRERRVCEMVHL